jgi:SAM-dependent methyltransferase
LAILKNQFSRFLLRRLWSPQDRGNSGTSLEASQAKIVTHLGPTAWAELEGLTVIDFGCGSGMEAIAMVKGGASRVIGIEIREDLIARAKELASEHGVADRCRFLKETDERADTIISLDSFEHFSDPAAELERMSTLVQPQGEVRISFGWPWYHPYGGHLFSVFPWAHLLFSEELLIEWRSQAKSDGASRFQEVEGGLNQMSIARFENLVAPSPFDRAQFNLVPIRAFRWLHNQYTCECTTALVQARLQI